MRQAGRYLPEYNEVRRKTSFLGLCKNPELAAEVTIQPIRRFAPDAAIIFSDILVPVEAMGVPLDYQPGPVLGTTVSTMADVERLKVPDPLSTMGFVMEAIKTFIRKVPDTPLIGFAGAPFTLAAYMVEGGGSKHYAETKRLLFNQPDVADALLSKLSDVISSHLIAQAEAGACAVQIFDSWAGYLSPTDYMRFGFPHTVKIVERVKKACDVPVIVFAKGMTACLDELSQSGADVLGVDWTLPLNRAGELTGHRAALQGNLDPCALLGPPERIEAEVKRVFSEAKGLKGHVFNLGHGILPMTPPEHMGALIDAVKRHGART